MADQPVTLAQLEKLLAAQRLAQIETRLYDLERRRGPQA